MPRQGWLGGAATTTDGHYHIMARRSKAGPAVPPPLPTDTSAQLHDGFPSRDTCSVTCALLAMKSDDQGSFGYTVGRPATSRRLHRCKIIGCGSVAVKLVRGELMGWTLYRPS
ncbi:hypothetical protein PI125_g10191 [Phytophthora idaei]|nr:hypothetical protein PI125_g10191 [Phytophthora idaei]